jgi:hypothetical protein
LIGDVKTYDDPVLLVRDHELCVAARLAWLPLSHEKAGFDVRIEEVLECVWVMVELGEERGDEVALLASGGRRYEVVIAGDDVRLAF